MKRILALIIPLFTLLIFSSLFFQTAESQPAPPVVELKLHRGTFDALTMPPLSPESAPEQSPVGNYAIIQFDAPVSKETREALQDAGLKIMEYIPDFAYLVQGNTMALAEAEQLSGFYAQVPFTVADKLSPVLLNRLGEDEKHLVRAIAWPQQFESLQQQLKALPFSLKQPITDEQLLIVAQLASVRWLEIESRPQLLNDAERIVTQVNDVWTDTGFYGEGQIVAIADSGLDTGDLGTISADFSGRISATFILSDGADWADQNGHGTHVAGTAVGAGVRSGADPSQNDYIGSFAGVAPKASLVVQAFEADGSGQVSGLDADYYQLFAQAYYTGGARIHSNSWGDVSGDQFNPYGAYTFGAMRADQFVWDHPDMAIFFAAGNSGIDGIRTGSPPFSSCYGGDGVIDLDSMLTPATAKNVISVGASESESEGGLSGTPWFLLDFCFTNTVFVYDTVSNNANGMAAFSSRGPTDDGRIKPDIVVPGTNVVSVYSKHPDARNSLFTVHPTYPNDYFYTAGTSMATPHAAGLAALIREWLVTRGTSAPSAALIKGLLLNNTDNMAPGQYGFGPLQEVPFARPNNVTGWGRANASFLAHESEYFHTWYDDHTVGLATGDIVTYTDSVTTPLEVLTDSVPLRIMLTWTDYPASLSAASQLVNDLDLIVTTPNGTVFHGNNIDADRINNMEGVIIDTPQLGTYTVTVQAFNVPSYTQPYALVVSGGLVEPPNKVPTAQDDTYQAVHGVSVPLVVDEVVGVLANDVDLDKNTVLTAVHTYTPTVGTLDFLSSGAFTYTAPVSFTGAVTFTYYATDGISNSVEALVTINVQPTPCHLLSAGPVYIYAEQFAGDHMRIHWSMNLANSGGYAIYRADTPYFNVEDGQLMALISATSSNTYFDYNGAVSAPNYYLVQGRNCDGSLTYESYQAGVILFPITPGQ